MRDPRVYVIPEFVSNAYQFSSDEESLNEEEIEVLSRYENFSRKPAHCFSSLHNQIKAGFLIIDSALPEK